MRTASDYWSNPHQPYASMPNFSPSSEVSQRKHSPHSTGDVISTLGQNSFLRKRPRSSQSEQDVRMSKPSVKGAFIHHSVQQLPPPVDQHPTIATYFQIRPEQQQYAEFTVDRSAMSLIKEFQVVATAKVMDRSMLMEGQVMLTDYSSQQQEIYKVMQSKRVFVDVLFPPGEKTLLGGMPSTDERYTTRKQQLAWQKITDYIWNAGLFTGGISPLNITQGEFGTNYFLMGLSALAERPERIRQIFLAKEVRQQGIFACCILYKGRRKSLYLDSYFPLPKNQYMGMLGCSKGGQSQLWVSVLEKAWAKLYGSYYAIEGGSVEEPLHDLTGAHMRFVRSQDKDFNKNSLWSQLLQASYLGYTVVVEAGQKSPSRPAGTQPTHCYTVLCVYEINFLNEKARIVKCRSPWLRQKLGLQWSKSDPRWSWVSQADKQKTGYFRRSQQSEFFLSFDDCCRWFNKITIAEIHDSASYFYCSQSANSGQARFFKLTVFQGGWYSLQLNQTPAREFTRSKNAQFQYLTSHMSIGRILSNGELQWYRGAHGAHRILFRKQMLPQGEYIVCTELDFYADDPYKEATLGVYGQHYCQISPADPAATDHFHRKLFLSRAHMIARPINRTRDIFQASEYIDGYLYVAVLNKTNKPVDIDLEYTICQDRSLDNVNPSVERVEPGTRRILEMSDFLMLRKVSTSGVWTTKLCGIKLIG